MFTPDGEGTVIRWTYEFKPRRGRYLLVRRGLAPVWRHYMQAGIEAAAKACESALCHSSSKTMEPVHPMSALARGRSLRQRNAGQSLTAARCSRALRPLHQTDSGRRV